MPDFVLEEHDGELSFSMPRFNIPELRVNRKYAEHRFTGLDDYEDFKDSLDAKGIKWPLEDDTSNEDLPG